MTTMDEDERAPFAIAGLSQTIQQCLTYLGVAETFDLWAPGLEYLRRARHYHYRASLRYRTWQGMITVTEAPAERERLLQPVARWLGERLAITDLYVHQGYNDATDLPLQVQTLLCQPDADPLPDTAFNLIRFSLQPKSSRGNPAFDADDHPEPMDNPTGPRDLWTEWIVEETLLYIELLQGDLYLQRARRELQARLAALPARTETNPPRPWLERLDPPAAVEALLRLCVWQYLRFYPEVEAGYADTFGIVAWYPLAADPSSPLYHLKTEFADLFYFYLRCQQLHHPASPVVVEALQQVSRDLLLDSREILLGDIIPYTPPLAIALYNQEQARRLQQALETVRAGTAPDQPLAARLAPVLAAWQVFLHWYHWNFEAMRKTLRDWRQTTPTSMPLRLWLERYDGELAFQQGDYDNAIWHWTQSWQDSQLLSYYVQKQSETQGSARKPEAELLRQRAAQWGNDLAQLIGNAFFLLGEEAQAQSWYALQPAALDLPNDAPPEQVRLAAYHRMRAALNRGVLAYLQSNRADYRGYISLTAEERLRSTLGADAPDYMVVRKISHQLTQLATAEAAFTDAEAALAQWLPGDSDLEDSLREDYSQQIRLNQTSVLWARAEVAAEIEPLGADFRRIHATGSLERMYQTFREQVAMLDGASQMYRDACGAFLDIAEAVKAVREAAEPGAPSPKGKVAGILTAPTMPLSLSGDSPRRLLVQLMAWLNAAECGLEIQRYPFAWEIAEQIFNTIRQFTGQPVDQPFRSVFPDLEWRVYWVQARAAAALDDKTVAEQCFESALSVVQSLQSLIGSDQWQAAALQDKWEFYESYITFLFRHRTAPDDKAQNAHIFDLVERAKGQSLRRLLQVTRTPAASLVDETRYRSLESQRKHINTLSDKIRNVMRRPTITEKQIAEVLNYQQEQRTAYQIWESLLGQLQQDHTLLDDASHTLLRQATYTEVEAPLWQSPHPLVLYTYFMGKNASYVAMVQRDAFEVHQISALAADDSPTPQTATRLAIEFEVNRLLVQIASASPNPDIFLKSSRRVATMLIPGAEQAMVEAWRTSDTHVLLAPDGILWHLPFEALLLTTPEITTSEQIPFFTACIPHYLLSAAPVRYVQSLGVWLELHRTTSAAPAAPRHSLFGIYNVSYQESDEEEAPLPDALRGYALTMRNVASGLVAQVLNSGGYINPPFYFLAAKDNANMPSPRNKQSSEANFRRLFKPRKRRQPFARELLFVGHGIYNDQLPQRSGLVFNLRRKGTRASTEDGYLNLADLFALEMPGLAIAFLACCQSALGGWAHGEGLNGLTRALMYKGAATVIASLWKVDEDATLWLVRHFFVETAVNPGQEPYERLWQSKLAFLQAESNSAAVPAPPVPIPVLKKWADRVFPFYWAAFVAYGK